MGAEASVKASHRGHHAVHQDRRGQGNIGSPTRGSRPPCSSPSCRGCPRPAPSTHPRPHASSRTEPRASVSRAAGTDAAQSAGPNTATAAAAITASTRGNTMLRARRRLRGGGQGSVHRVEVERVAGDLDARPALLPDGLDGAAAAPDEASSLNVGDEEAEGVGDAVRVSAGEPHDGVGVGTYGPGVAEDVGEGELDGVEGARCRDHAVVRVSVEACAAVADRYLRPGNLREAGIIWGGRGGGSGGYCG